MPVWVEDNREIPGIKNEDDGREAELKPQLF